MHVNLSSVSVLSCTVITFIAVYCVIIPIAICDNCEHHTSYINLAMQKTVRSNGNLVTGKKFSVRYIEMFEWYHVARILAIPLSKKS